MAKLIIVDFHVQRFPSPLSPLYESASRMILNLRYSFNIKKIKRLNENKATVVVLDSESESMLGNSGVDCIHFERYIPEEAKRKVLEDSVRLVEELGKSLGSAATYKGISLWDMELIDSWGSFFYKAVKKIFYFNEIIKKTRPEKIFLFTSSYEEAYLFSEAAKQKGIPVSIESPFSKAAYSAKMMLMPLAFKTISTKSLMPIRAADKSGNKTGKKKGRLKKAVIIRDDDSAFRETIHLANAIKKVRIEVLVIGVANCRKRYEKEGIDFKTFSDFRDEEAKKTANQGGERLKRALKDLKENDFGDSIKYEGISLWPIVSNYFNFLFNFRFAKIIEYIETMNRMVEKEKPDIVILNDDIGVFGKSIAFSAKKNKVKCLTIQHGIFGDVPALKCYSDMIAVYGEYSKRIFMKNSTPEGRIALTGNIKFDLLPKQAGKKEKIHKMFSIPIHKRLVLLAAPRGSTEKIETVIRAVSSLPETCLIIKIHPGERRTEQFNRLKKKFGCGFIITKDTDIYELIIASDVLILTYPSTVGLEALAFGKPLIDLSKKASSVNDWPNFDIPYVEEGVAIKAESESELKNALEKIFHDKGKKKSGNIKRFIRRFAYRIDGKSAERIAALISKMVK